MNEPTQPHRPRPAGQAELSVPLWALAFVAALFGVTCLSAWAFVLISRPTVPPATSSAVFVVLTQAPPSAVPGLPGAATPLFATEPPTATVPPSINPGAINLGSFVQVVRTEGDPLKLRQAPSLTASTNYLAIPNEVLKVENGPTIADGFTWWFLVDPVDRNRNGWAVENYLDATAGP